MKRNTIFLEWYKNNTYVATTMRTIGTVKITTGVDTVPTMALQLPLEDLPEQNLAVYDIKVHIQVEGVEKYMFWGVVDEMELDYANYTVNLSLSHRISRMRDWAMPANYTVKNTNISHIIGPNGVNLGNASTVAFINSESQYDFKIDFSIQSDPTVEMTFSSTDKLSALQELVEATEKCHWYVDLTDPEGNQIVIGELGNEVDVEISPNPIYNDECEEPNRRYVTMLTEPVYNVDYTDHYNRAIVFCGDIAEGVEHMTLREVYEDKSLQDPKFPVGMYENEINLQPETAYKDGKKINNEQIYKDNEIVAYANNTNREYYVTDVEQLMEDGGIVRNTTFQFSQIYPIPKLSETDDNGNTIEYAITDADRIEMTKRAYQKAIRELKAQRPDHAYQFNTTALPVERGVCDGCKMHFVYTKKVTEFEGDDDCGDNHLRTVTNVDVKYYMVNRIITFDEALNEYTTLTLNRDLKPRAIDAVEWQLSQKVNDTPGKGKYNKTTSFGDIRNELDDRFMPRQSSKSINNFNG